MVDDLCDSMGKYRTWRYSTGVSGYQAIILHLYINQDFTQYPFKFNSSWLDVEDLLTYVNTQWGILTYETPPWTDAFSPSQNKKATVLGHDLGKGQEG